MEKLGMEEDEPIEHKMISRAIENAQRKVEGHNFDIRKHLLEYDDVMNKQREVIYRQRREVLEGGDLKNVIKDMMSDVTEGIVDEFVKPKMPSEDWDWEGVSERMQAEIGFPLEWVEDARRDLNRDEFAEKLLATVNDAYAEKEKAVGEKTMRQLERYVLLQMVDTYWKEHLLNMDHLKEGIGLQGYGQKNPLNEYKKEGFNMFMAVMETVKQKTVDTLFRIQLVQDDEVDQMSMEQRRKKQQTKANRRDGEIGRQPVIREGQKIGRNAPCPCGSGKKYKRCCGKK